MKIRIKQYHFEVSEPFQPGHRLNEAEAQALNGLRAEHIRDNVSKVVSKALAESQDGALLSPKALEEVSRAIAQYDSRYNFIFKHEPRAKRGLLESVVRGLAEEWVEVQLRQQDLTLSEEDREKLILQTEQLEPIQTAARERLAVQQSVARETLEDLL